ncbi:MAG TPA: DUF2382 domain-containing protein [Aromatoleum sp.]|uniref:DUF2382 domain-containing protein n=1 Tax=Aromatoleum sp. TaxID=2307007 RepID=UPI002B48FA81|nr:DUF2382 domain-containing protein [Aromatoleum sp.]HJV28580.1 DUF2382 domain-containing protein [Aromatoleum sp.]
MSDSNTPADTQATVVPVITEDLSVVRVTEKTGQAVRVRVVSEEQTKRVPLVDVVDELSVERVPINQVVAERLPPRADGDALIVPVYETIAVVEHRLVLKEELRIVRSKRKVARGQDVVVREETAIVERRDTEDGDWRPEEPIDIPGI